VSLIERWIGIASKVKKAMGPTNPMLSHFITRKLPETCPFRPSDQRRPKCYPLPPFCQLYANTTP
jgi:hypothetical protein